MDDEEKILLAALLWILYLEAFSDSAYDVAREYSLERHLPSAIDRAKPAFKERLKLVEKAVTNYIEKLEERVVELKAEGKSPVEVKAEIDRLARSLADEHGQVIAEVESHAGRLAGADAVAQESGQPFVWVFPHFNFNNDIECPTCEGIRRGGPYTMEQARAKGIPFLPHIHCDHGWVLTPA